MQLKNKGFTLIEIMVVVAIIGLVMSIAMPNFVEARRRAVEVTCLANQRIIEGEITISSIENNLGLLVIQGGELPWVPIEFTLFEEQFSVQCDNDTGAILFFSQGTPSALKCPSGTNYTLSAIQSTGILSVTCALHPS